MKHNKMAILALSLAALTSLYGCSSSSTASSTSAASEATTTTEAQTEAVTTTEAVPKTLYSDDQDASHAITADGETVTYDNVEVEKTGDDSGDNADFYGTNAAVFATNGANLTITNSLIKSSGSHANAVFSYGEGTTLTISDSTIETEQNNSGGIMVTGGGTLIATNLIVSTQAGSSAAIRSDRGGGTMTVTGGTYSSYGSGSPAIYSTADITVNDATLYSDISQAVVVEGKNSVTLNNVDATGKNTKKNSSKSDVYQAVMIYQSMSGDASEGKGTFTMNGGSLTSLNGGMFYVTNTTADISLTNVSLSYASDDLLRLEAAGWGSSGSNGGKANVYASQQALVGVISVDEISQLNLYLSDGSTFNGSITGDGQVYVELSGGSTWTLTDDVSIAGLTCEAGAINLNGHTLTVNGTTYTDGSASTGEAIVFTTSSSSKSSGSGSGSGSGNGSGSGSSSSKSKPSSKPSN